MKRLHLQRLAIAGLLTPLAITQAGVGLALPPPEDVPEEVLRTQIILDARSPIDGKPMTPAEYAALQAREQAAFQQPIGQVAPQVRDVVNALRVRRFIKRFLPFIPIK